MLLRAPDLNVDKNDPFAEGALDRKNIAEGVAELLASLNGPFVLSIDSPWGTGKTTFIQMLKVLLEEKGHPCLYFNAWETDFSADPLVAFVGELDNIFQSFAPDEIERIKLIKSMRAVTSIVAKRAFPTALKIATVGVVDAEELLEKFASDFTGKLGDDVVETYLKERRANSVFREKLNELIERASDFGKKVPAIIFVDELDRCRPDYAIELLERVKHLFNVPNVIFVISIDKKQMCSSLSAVYGAGIDGNSYLKRFFDIELKLSAVGNELFCDSLMRRMSLDSFFSSRLSSGSDELGKFRMVFHTLSNLWGLSLRAQEKSMALAAIAMRSTPEGSPFYPVQIAIISIVRIAEEDIYSELKNGQSVFMLYNKLVSLFDANGQVDAYQAAFISGFLLSMANRDDEKVSSYLQQVKQRIDIDQNAETIYQIACDRFSLKIRQAIEKIDLAAQFSV